MEIKSLIERSILSDTGNTICVLGMSGCGKSFLLVNKILPILRNISEEMIELFLVGNLNCEFYNLKKDIVFEGFRPKIIESCRLINKNTKNKYNFWFIIDDLLSLRGREQLRNLMLSYRNTRLSTLILLQNPTLVFKNERSNARIYFLGFYALDEDVESVIKRFLRSFEPFKSMDSMEDKILRYKEMTRNHKFIVYFPHLEVDKLYLI